MCGCGFSSPNPKCGAPPWNIDRRHGKMAATEDRERVIRAAWGERGKAQWDPNTHGRGLLALRIRAKVEMRPVRPGAPLPPYDDLEFRLVRATMGGQPINSIVCEGVVVETVQGSMPPSTGWMNSGDDAANQVVQAMAANRRRNMAAISSEPTSVASAPEQPPQGLGMTGSARNGAQGRATLTVTFADNEAVTGWLSGQTDDVAVVFAARAALRVLPTITFSRWPGSGRSTTHEIVLRVFRAVAAAWAVAAYPGQRNALNNAARAALSGLSDLQAPSPIRAAVYASAAATGEAGAPSRASTVIGYALDAVGSKGREPFEQFLEALATDATALDQMFNTATWAHSKLWPGRIPDWVPEDWGELSAALLSENQDWDVWTEWYDERLVGGLANQDIQIARATIEDPIWQQSPKVVNAHIKELTMERKIFQHATADDPDELPDVDSIPQQATTASQFTVDAEGRLDLLPDAPLPDDRQREIYQDVRYKAVALSGLGHNQLAGMYEPIARFLTAAPERIEDVSVTRLWSRGNTLRSRLKAHDIAAISVDPTDPAILSASVAELLRDLVDTYNVFTVGDPTGRELDQVRLGPQERNDANAIVYLAVTITEAVQTSEGLATAAAIEALVEQVEAARTAPPGIDGDQAIDLSRKTTSNFVIELLRSACARVRAEPRFAWKEYRAGVYRGLGAVTAAGVAGWPIISFIANNAQALKSFVEETLHNSTLIKIIEVISKVGAVQ
jgi:hypothetical protein